MIETIIVLGLAVLTTAVVVIAVIQYNHYQLYKQILVKQQLVNAYQNDLNTAVYDTIHRDVPTTTVINKQTQYMTQLGDLVSKL